MPLNHRHLQEKAIGWFLELGLDVRMVPGANGFCPGVAIVQGQLQVDPDAAISTVLHEAAHLALLPPEIRQHANGDLEGAMALFFSSVGGLGPDHPAQRAAMQCGDAEATAWAWAAGCHLDVPQRQIILDSEYNGEGQSIREYLSMGMYFGIHGLASMGWCALPRKAHGHLKAFPELSLWTQPTYNLMPTP